MAPTWPSASGALTMKPTTFCCRMSFQLCAGSEGPRLRWEALVRSQCLSSVEHIFIAAFQIKLYHYTIMMTKGVQSRMYTLCLAIPLLNCFLCSWSPSPQEAASCHDSVSWHQRSLAQLVWWRRSPLALQRITCWSSRSAKTPGP